MHKSTLLLLVLLPTAVSGAPKDATEAVKLYRLAAIQGKSDAQNSLGVSYAKGEGVPEDDAEAVKWYRKAADQGNAKAQDNLGAMFANGTGVARNDIEAVKWFRKAADQGHAEGQLALGVMYLNGRGVPKNSVEAVEWFRKAADQGCASAQNNLGVMYFNGEGVAQDYTEAAKWYRKAADQGHAEAQCNLGVIYANGDGVAQDSGEAEKWFRLAIEKSGVDTQRDPKYEENKRLVDGSPISKVYLDLSLAGPPYGQVQQGTIYPLTFMRMVQKVPNGYLMRADPPAGGAVSTELAFLKTEANLSENAIFLDMVHFAMCTGTYAYEAVNGFTRTIYEFSPLTDEANGYVIERLKAQAAATENNTAPVVELAAARDAAGKGPER